MSPDVEGKRIVVTGAASGIGRCFAETLAESGATGLGLIDISGDGLAEVARALGSRGAAAGDGRAGDAGAGSGGTTDCGAATPGAGAPVAADAGAATGDADAGSTPPPAAPKIATRVADVSDAGAVQAAIDELVAELGGLDWAIHCAAILGPGTFAEQPCGDFDRVIRVNLLGTANVARACLPHLRRTAGAIACIASTAAVHGWPEMSAYSASKFGVSGLCDAIRQEFAREGVCVTTVYPLLIDTPLLAGAERAPILKQGKAIAPRAVVYKTLAGLARRKARVFVPGRVRAIAAAHGLAPSLLDAYGRRFGLRG